MKFIDGKTLKKSNGEYGSHGFLGDMNITKSLWVNPWSLTEYEFHQQSMLSAFLFHFKELFTSHGNDGFTDLTVNHQRSWSTSALIQFLQFNSDCVNSTDITEMPETNSRT